MLCEMVDPILLQGLIALIFQHVINDGVLAQKDVQDLLAAGRKIV